jgi:hypothetical protein
MSEDKLLRCPQCNSDMVTVEWITEYMVNSGDHYCHIMKTHDPDTRAHCLSCGWNGYRMNLVTDGEYDNTNN